MSRRLHRFRPSVEALEDRLVPSDSAVFDPTFSQDGLLFYGGSSSDTPVGLLPQADGGTLVASGSGPIYSGEQTVFVLSRFLANGSPDPSFGTNGVSRTNLTPNDYDPIVAVTLQPDGKIVGVGRTYNGFDTFPAEVLVVRFNADGSLDPTFDGDGIRRFNPSTNQDFAQTVLVQPDGKIVLTVDAQTNTPNIADAKRGTHVFRLNPDGSTDATFGNGGSLWLPNVYTQQIARNSDGKLLLLGTQTSYLLESDFDFLVLQLTAAGQLDTTFGSNGVARVDFNLPNWTSSDVPQVMTLLPDNTILVAGWAPVSFGSSYNQPVLARLTPNGSLDTTFAGTGNVRVPWPAEHRIIFVPGVHVLSDGQLLVAALYSTPAGWHTELQRVNADGSPDTSFGPGGIIPLASDPPYPYTDFFPTRVAWQADGKLILVGQRTGLANNPDVVVARQILKGSGNSGNQAPTATADAYRVNAGARLDVPVARGVLTNDSDLDGPAPLKAILESGPAHGTLVLRANGSFWYRPAAGFLGTDTFTYRARDGGKATSEVTTVTLDVRPAARVTHFKVNDGNAQRSMVTSLTVTFSEAVTLDPGAFTLTRKGSTAPEPLLVTLSAGGSGQTIATITFPNPRLLGDSLLDGSYRLKLSQRKVHFGPGLAFDGNGDGLPGGDGLFLFHRFFGDSDGNALVDGTDQTAFTAWQNGDLSWAAVFDLDGGGNFSGADQLAFDAHFGKRLKL